MAGSVDGRYPVANSNNYQRAVKFLQLLHAQLKEKIVEPPHSEYSPEEKLEMYIGKGCPYDVHKNMKLYLCGLFDELDSLNDDSRSFMELGRSHITTAIESDKFSVSVSLDVHYPS